MDIIIEKIKNIGTKNYLKENPKCKKQIKYLMKKYSTAYYEGNALISDLDFEVLVDTLKAINPKDKYLTTPGWGYKIKKGVKHIYGKIDTLRYFYSYEEMITLFSKNEEIIITPKFDGINFVSYFKKGKFNKCATRGNGNLGKNITWAFSNNYTFGENLAQKTFAINGEVIYLGDTNLEINFRDKVASYLNKKGKINPKMYFMPFGLLNTNYSKDYLMQIIEMNKISKQKIPYTIHPNIPSKNKLKQLYKKYQKDYAIDGLVITTRNKSIQIAYKFKEE